MGMGIEERGEDDPPRRHVAVGKTDGMSQPNGAGRADAGPAGSPVTSIHGVVETSQERTAFIVWVSFMITSWDWRCLD